MTPPDRRSAEACRIDVDGVEVDKLVLGAPDPPWIRGDRDGKAAVAKVYAGADTLEGP